MARPERQAIAVVCVQAGLTTPFAGGSGACHPAISRRTYSAVLCGTATAGTRRQAHDADVGVEVLLGGKLTIAENHSADEGPDQAETHAERGWN